MSEKNKLPPVSAAEGHKPSGRRAAGSLYGRVLFDIKKVPAAKTGINIIFVGGAHKKARAVMLRAMRRMARNGTGGRLKAKLLRAWFYAGGSRPQARTNGTNAKKWEGAK